MIQESHVLNCHIQILFYKMFLHDSYGRNIERERRYASKNVGVEKTN